LACFIKIAQHAPHHVSTHSGTISLQTTNRKRSAHGFARLDAVLGSLYESFKTGQSVPLSGFGNFYVRPERER